ncbi:MAG: SDR family oxidoreductase [Gallionella sp.]|nr:SDR family oxidoreductase [Gallionella sp.]
MKRLLIIGCGDVARRTLPLLLSHYRVFALVRRPESFAALREQGVVPILGDLDSYSSLSRLAGLADAVLHFAPPPAQGNTDSRTRNLLRALSQHHVPQQLVYISTSGVYGDCSGAWIDETRTCNATSPRAQRRVDAEKQIRYWAKSHRVNACILRVPGIYAMDRLPVQRIQQGSPAIVAAEDGYTNHIHADDLARIACAALRHGKPCRIYHASDDQPMKMGDYFDAVADAFGLARVSRISHAAAQQVLSPSLLSFINESGRLDNRRLSTELKVKLIYPTLAALLAQL